MKRIKQSLALLTLLSMASYVQADCNWRSLNHDHRNTRSNPCEKILSSDNVINLQELWSISGASVESAPIYENGIVYYTDIAGNLFSRDATTGTLLQQVNLGSPIVGSPLVTGTTVYVATTGLILYAIDKTNFATTVWSSVIDPAALATGQATVEASPVIIDDIVIIGVTPGEITENGNPNPVVRGSLNAFNAATGSLIWQFVPSQSFEGYGVGFWSTPAFDAKRKLLFIGTSNTLTFPAAKLSDSLIAINYKTGTVKWVQQITKNDVYGYNNPTGPDRDVGASPNLFTADPSGSSSGSHGKKDLVGVCSKDGVYRTFDRSSGKHAWKTVISRSGSRVGDPSAAVRGCRTIYALSNEDLTYTINGPTVVEAYTDDCNPEAYQTYQNGLAFSTNTVIKALDAATGEVIWEDVSQGATFASITEANGILYHTNFVGDIRMLDAESGTVLNVIPGEAFETANAAPITVTDGLVFVGLGIEDTYPVNGIAVFSVP